MANLKVKVTPQNNLLITNYRVFQGSSIRIADIFDVNTAGAIDGSMLIFNGVENKWLADVDIDSPNVTIDGGEF
jgi:hypothetical protein